MASGTKVASVWVDIAGDLANYNRSLEEAKAKAVGLGQQIRQALAGQGAQGTGFTSGIASAIEDLKHGLPLSAAIRNNLGGIASDFRAAGGSVVRNFASDILTLGGAAFRGVGNIAHGVFNSLRSAAGSIFRGIGVGFGITAFLSLEQVVSRIARAIPDLINRGKDYAESVHTITIETGASAENSSQLLAIYQFLGGTQTDLNQKVNRLSTTIKRQEAGLQALGVVTRDSNGNLLDQVTLIDNLRKVYSTLPQGIIETNHALLSFGRNGATALGPLLHYLGLTDDEINKLAADAKSQGLILSESQLLAADAAGKAAARIQNAITGLSVTLNTTILPQLASFFDGLSTYITANAKQIASVISGVVANIIGLVQGLLGINLGSFSAQFSQAAQGGSQWAGALINDTAALTKLQKQLHPTANAVRDNNAAIAAGTKAIDEETKSIDKQIAAWKLIGEEAVKALNKQLAALTAVEDKQLAALDTADQLAQRARTAADLARSGEKAQDTLAKSQRDYAKSQVDLANAQAQYNQDLADTTLIGQKRQDALARDSIAIADAAQRERDALVSVADARQGIADNQQAITDNAAKNAEDDRRAQIEAVKAYVASIGKLVSESENKTALAHTLTNRQKKLEDEIAAAKAKGNATEAADLEIKLQAVIAAEHENTVAKNVKAKTDELTAKKTLLEAEKAALQAERQSETAINQAEIGKQIAALKAKIAEDKRQLADEAAARKKHQEELDQGLITTAKTSDTVLDPAFERARLAGIAMAEGIKAAIGGIIDLLLGGQTVVGGDEGPISRTTKRSGGLLAAVHDIASGFLDIAANISKFVAALPGKGDITKLALIGAAFAALSGHFALSVALLAVAGASVGPETLNNPGPQSPQPKVPGTDIPLPHMVLAEGGWVPGAIGQAVPAIVHGGEYVVSTAMQAAMSRLNAQPSFAGVSSGIGAPSAPSGYRYALVRVEASENDLVDWMYAKTNARRGRS
jgi:hypothetical protein